MSEPQDLSGYFGSDFQAAFGSTAAFQSFEQTVSQSPLLVGMLIQFAANNGQIHLTSASLQGTYSTAATSTTPATININPSLFANVSTKLGAQMLADAIAHELGHELLVNGTGQSAHTAASSAATLSGAVTVGEADEGMAETAEYVVAEQLGIVSPSNPATPIQASDSSGGLTKALTNIATSMGLTLSQIDQIDSVNTLETTDSGFLASALLKGGTWIASRPPSTATHMSYKNLWQDSWVLKNSYGIDSSFVSWASMTVSKLTVTPQGTFTGTNIPLQMNKLPNGSFVGAVINAGLWSFNAVAGETLSFSGATSVQRGVVTLSTGLATTVVGGLGNNDVLTGRPGLNTFDVELQTVPIVNGITIIPFSGRDTLSIRGVTPVDSLATAPLQAESKVGPLEQWSSTGQPGGDQYTYNPTLHTMTISSASGTLGNNILVIDKFNLDAAESSAGFMGIYLKPPSDLNFAATTGVDPPAPTFDAGSTQAYTFSTDAASDTARTIALTLSGVNPADFQALIDNQAVQQNSNGTFSFLLPAGQTSVSFSLTNTTDAGSNGSLQLTAALSDPSNPNVGAVISNSLTQNFVEPTDDPFSTPQSSLYYDGSDTTSGSSGISYSCAAPP